MTSHPTFPTSASQVEELSSSLQAGCARQTGTLICDHSGLVLAASGDAKEAPERLAHTLLTLLRDANGVLVHSATKAQGAPASKEDLVKITISFKTYQYCVSLTHDLLVCVKTNLD